MIFGLQVTARLHKRFSKSSFCTTEQRVRLKYVIYLLIDEFYIEIEIEIGHLKQATCAEHFFLRNTGTCYMYLTF